MKLSSIKRPSPAMAVAVMALVIGLGGTAAVATGTLQKGDKLIAKNSLSGNRLRNQTITQTQTKPLVWHNLTLENGWTVYNGGFYGIPRYAIDNQGIVHLRGAINGSAKTATQFATLPVGYRPAPSDTWLAVASTNGSTDPHVVDIDITNAGVMNVDGGGTANLNFVSLAGVTFDVS